MKRLSFFLGVFSVGLVAFLLLTGQFGSPEIDPSSSTEPDRFPEVKQNRVTHHSYDYTLGRLRFTLRGEMDLSSGVVLSPENLVSQRALIDATIELPVYADGRTEPVDQILFEAEKIITDPSGEEARVIGELRGQGAGGAPQMETSDLSIRWADGEDIRIEGESPVKVAWPAMKLRSANGLTGSIGSSSGLQELSFAPPVIVAMMTADVVSDDTGAPGETTDPEVATPRQVRIICEGPITLAGSEQGARFDGGVRIFESEVEAQLDPLAAVPARHIAADFLDLHLEPISRRLLRIHSQRRENPITIYLGDGIRVQGEQLDWKDGDREVRLSGGIAIFSEMGTFQADEARIELGSSRCIVEGSVTGTLKGEPTSPGENSSLPVPIEGDWRVTAETAQFEFSDGRLKTLAARGRDGESVSINEIGEGGATIIGDELRWRAVEKELEVFSSSGRRALFTDGKNRVEANTAALSVDPTRLVFRGRVGAELHELPRGPSVTSPRWLGEDSSGELEAEQLTLFWDGKQRLKQLEATADATPLSLAIRGNEPVQLTGNRLEWRGADAVIRIEGEGRQQLSIGNRAVLEADRLRLSMVEGQAMGEGAVKGTLKRPGAPEEDPPLVIDCSSLVVSLAREEASESAEEEVASASNYPLGNIEGVRALGDQDRPVQIDDGTIRASGQELLWNAQSQQFRFQGPGLQQVQIFSGSEEPDLVLADTISLDRIAGTVELVGDARALLYLAKGPQIEGLAAEPDADELLSWKLRADRIDAKLDIRARQIRLSEVEAQGSVRLLQEQGGIEFRGQNCHWDHQYQRLTLSSPDGQGLQTFVRGQEPRDEVVAREVVVVRSTAPGKEARERLEVLLSSVLSAVIQLEPTSDQKTGSFELRADELLLVLREDEESGSLRPHEALAWGATDLRGGPYRILAEQARVLARNRSVELTGGDHQPVQVFREGNSDLPPSRSVKLTWGPRGYRVQNLPKGGGWSVSDIDAALERMGRRDRRPAS
ncbi:MAG: hypothetical protein VX764_04590 [Planctomycetota bacterium]|nr:hypothetical protein [Planctomycetota bacterium]